MLCSRDAAKAVADDPGKHRPGDMVGDALPSLRDRDVFHDQPFQIPVLVQVLHGAALIINLPRRRYDGGGYLAPRQRLRGPFTIILSY
jgi:hypothetical protein